MKHTIIRSPDPSSNPPGAAQGSFAYAAFSMGKSTASQVERPSHFLQRGKLASFSSITSSPQHSEAYRPASNTSCPVFITSTSHTVVVVRLTGLHGEVLCLKCWYVV